MRAIGVVGAAGFLGRSLVSLLLTEGKTVIGFDQNEQKISHNRYQHVLGDIEDLSLLQSTIDQCDVVVCLAGFASLDEAATRPIETVKSNVLCTVHVLEACKEANVKKFLYASSAYVMGSYGGFYRCSKVAAESYIEQYGRQYGLNYTILRYGSLYGPDFGIGNGVYDIISQLHACVEVLRVTNPNSSRDYLYVDDAALITVEAMKAQYNSQRLLVAGERPVSKGELIELICEILGRPKPEIIEVEAGGEHYKTTPVTFSPEISRRVSLPVSTDIANGVLSILKRLQPPTIA